VAFAIVMPPLQVPDEEAHFIRAYVISRGENIGKAIPKIPAPIASFVMRYPEMADQFHWFTPQEIVRDLSTRTVAPADAVLSNEDGHHKYLLAGVIASSVYCPLVYVPAVLGVWLARSLHASPLLMMYAARLFSIFAFVGALAVAFRLAPGYRALMTAVALMPMTLQQAGGVSADTVTIAFSFVGLGLVLYAREHPVTRRFLALVVLVFVMWSLCKFSIWSFPLLWLIPASNFKNRRAWLAYIGVAAVCMVGALLIWNGITADNREALRTVRLAHGVDISANVRLVAAHPLAFARHLLALVRHTYKSEVGQFVGGFAWTQFALPAWVRSMYLLLLVLVAATELSNKSFRPWERGVLLLVFFGGALFVHVVLSLSDTTLCAGNLSHVCLDSEPYVIHARYFIPMCLPGLLALRQNRVNLSQTNLLALVTGAGTLHALAALVLIRWTCYL